MTNTNKDSQQDSIERDSAGFPYRALAMVLIAAALVCAIIGIFMLVDNGRHQVQVLTEPTTTSASATRSQKASTDADKDNKGTASKKSDAKPAPLDKSSVTVVVLNNTTKNGYAARVTDEVKKAGWTRVAAPANCPQGACGTLDETTVYYGKKAGAKQNAEALAKELGYSVAPRPSWLRGHNEDVVVILAK